MKKYTKKIMGCLVTLFISACLSGCASSTGGGGIGSIIYLNKQDSLSCETERQILDNNEILEKSHK